MWRRFNETLLDVTTKYEKIDSSTARQTTTTKLKSDDGKVMVGVTEEVIGWEDIPKEIRSDMIKQNKKTAVYNSKDVVKKQLEKKLSEEGMAMTLA
jgi:hypothetical protein